MRASDRGMWLKAVGALVLIVIVSQAQAREAVVTTVDGQVFTGELVSQDPTTVVLRISGIKTPIPRKSIQSLQLKASPQEEYRRMRAQLQDDDLDGRYRLAFTMYEKKWLELSLTELNALAQRFPDSRKVTALASAVQERIEQERAKAAQSVPVAPTPRGQAAAPLTQEPDPTLRLTQEQISLIRIYEIDLATEPRVTLPSDTIDKLFETYASDDRLDKDRRAFRRKPGHEQLATLFDLQARELYSEVVIRQDPPAVKSFRSQLNRQYVLNYCAATGCHGDGSPGGLYLFRVQPNSNATVYTNLYILNRYENQAGRMIDRDEPRRSLLLQYGLARNTAATPHPETPGWRAQFVNEDDPRFHVYTDVLDQLWKPTPNYGISYTPPVWQEPTDHAQPTPNAK